MPTFYYKAAKADGQVLEGRLEAGDRDGVARLLQAQGSIPLQIDDAAPISAPTSKPSQRPWQRRSVTGTDIDLFTLELSTLLAAGLPIGQALDTLIKLTENPAMSAVVEEIGGAVRGGQSLATALEESHPGFDRFYCNMVQAGESSGALDLALERLAAFRAARRELRQSLISALIYPTILLVLAMIAVAVLLAFVVPQFTQLFADAGRELPLLTRIVVCAGDLVVNWWWLMLLSVIAAGWWLRNDWRSIEGRRRWDAWLLRVPLVGPLILKLNTARFSRTLSTLLGNGVNLLAALEIACEVVGNTVVANAVNRAARRVREGQGLATSLQETNALPSLATQLIGLGERSGKLPPLLDQVAGIFERDTQTSLKRLLTLAEPAIIISVALLITVIILSVVLMILESNNLAF